MEEDIWGNKQQVDVEQQSANSEITQNQQNNNSFSQEQSTNSENTQRQFVNVDNSINSNQNTEQQSNVVEEHNQSTIIQNTGEENTATQQIEKDATTQTPAQQNQTPVVQQPKPIQTHYEMPATMAMSTTLSRIGIILSNYAILGTILALSSLFIFIFYAFYYMLLVFAAICSLGLIFIAVPSFKDAFNTEFFDGIALAINTAMPYILIGTIGCSLLSLIFLFANKENRSMPRIIFSGVIVAFSVIFLIALLTQQGGAA